MAKKKSGIVKAAVGIGAVVVAGKVAYEKYKTIYTEIAQECENSEDRQEEIEEIAAVLPDRMREVLDQESSKRKKENVLMKYNLGMVTYVIPMFRYG